MSISDTCSESLHTLADGLRNYAYERYSKKDYKLLIDAMFNLEKVSIDPTFFELNEKSKIEAAINRSLILNIVSYEEEEMKSEDFERKNI